MGNKSTKVKYILTFPSFCQNEKDFTFNLVLYKSKRYSLPISFTATLKDVSGKILAERDFIQAVYGLQQHTFPKMASGLTAESMPSISIVVKKVGLGENQEIDERLSVLKERFIFIQTDKAMYKPTQTVHLRAFLLNRDLMPVDELISVTISDAKENKICIWKDKKLERGVFDASFVLSDFVNFGDWKISVSGAGLSSPTEKSFAVQQYVLPKYEAKIEFPAGYLQYSADEASHYGFVRAKYTFGKKIRGDAVLRILRDSSNDELEIGCYSENGAHLEDQRRARIEGDLILEQKLTLRGDDSLDDGRFTLVGLRDALSKFPSFYNCQMKVSKFQLKAVVKVKEDLTGEEIEGETTVSLYRDHYILSIHESVAKSLKAGLPFEVKLQVARPDESPINESVEISLNYTIKSDSDEILASDKTTLQTDEFGTASLVINVPKQAGNMYYRAHLLKDPETTVEDHKYISHTNSKQAISLKLACPTESSIPKVGDTIGIAVTASFSCDYVYLVLAQNGEALIYKKLDRLSEDSTFSVDIALPVKAAPRCDLIVWTVEPTCNEVLADAIKLKVDAVSSRQEVSAEFTPSVVKPGEPTQLTVRTSEPGSTVAMFAVDKSVKLLRSGNDITLEDVVNAVNCQESNEVDYQPVAPVIWRNSHSRYQPHMADSAFEIFRAAGMVIASNAHLGQRFMMTNFMMRGRGAGFGGFQDDMMVNNAFGGAPMMMRSMRAEIANVPVNLIENEKKPDVAPVPTVRMLFPETWFWSTSTTNDSGNAIQTVEAPDTVTSWLLSALVVGEKKGFGALGEPAELTVFQPFFVNLDIPYATVIRNEQFAIKAVVFNYLSTAQTIKLTLKKSLSFEISTDGGNTYASDTFLTTVQVPANDGQSVSLWLRPRQLGEISLELEGISVSGESSSDAIQKKISVEPEGETRYANRPIFVRRDHSELPAFETTISVDEMFGSVNKMQVVEGSRYFQLQVIGDLLGPALTQLGGQIRLPTGCGEQTLIILSPNVYIYKYLQTVNELTPELISTTTNFVLQGYQRELTYQRDDGGFSAFGKSDVASSTWLTAFAIRSFNAARKYLDTSIDPDVLDRAWNFIHRMSTSGGAFKEPGKIIHTDMQGGATSELNLATYIYITYAESGQKKLAWQSLAATRRMLESHVSNEMTSDNYQLALVAYAFSVLPEDREISIRALDRLVGAATISGNSTYWATIGQTSLIETAAYALLALCNVGRLDDALGVGRWLISQRNSLGGFSSTQDTVVGLQALAELSAKIATNGKNMQIKATLHFSDGPKTVTTEFSVQKNNAMLLQSFDVDRADQSLERVTLEAIGTGISIVQLALRYNILDQKLMDSGDFHISVSKQDGSGYDNSNFFIVTTIRALTHQAGNGMVVVELGVPTGFDGDLETTKLLNSITPSGALKRIEDAERKLIFYFDSLPSSKGENEASLSVKSKFSRKTVVKGAQLPVARVYAYYDTGRTKSILYSFDGL